MKNQLENLEHIMFDRITLMYKQVDYGAFDAYQDNLIKLEEDLISYRKLAGVDHHVKRNIVRFYEMLWILKR